MVAEGTGGELRLPLHSPWVTSPRGRRSPLDPVLSTPALLPTARSCGRALHVSSCQHLVEGAEESPPSSGVIHKVPGCPIQFILSLKQVSSYQDSAPCLSSPPAPGGPPTSATWAGASPYDTACLPPPTPGPGCPSAWNALPGASRRVWFLRPLRLSLDTGSTRQPSLVPPRAA